MVPSRLWLHFDKHLKYQMTYWYPSPLQWAPRWSKLFVNSMRCLRGWLIGALIVTMALTYTYVFAFMCLAKTLNMSFFTTVVSLAEVLGFAFVFVMNACTTLQREDICPRMNGIIKLAKTPPEGLLHATSLLRTKPSRVDRLMLSLLTMLQRSVKLSPVVTMLLPFALQSEPLYFLLNYIFSKIIFKGILWIFPVLCERILRGVILTIVLTHLLMDLYQYVIFLMVILMLQLKLFSITYVNQRLILANVKRCRRLKHGLIADELIRHLSFHSVFQAYRMIEVVSAFHDRITNVLYPFLIGIAFSANVLTGFIVCYGYNFVSKFVYAVVICLTIMIIFALACIFPRFCDFDVYSIEFRAFWKHRLYKKYDRLRLASLRPVRVGIKPFFYFRKSQYLFVVWNMISFSISFFLTFKDNLGQH